MVKKMDYTKVCWACGCQDMQKATDGFNLYYVCGNCGAGHVPMRKVRRAIKKVR